MNLRKNINQKVHSIYKPEDRVQIARVRSCKALLLNYKEPKLRMERIEGYMYQSSWETKGGVITETLSNNIFDIATPIICGETNRPETEYKAFVTY